MSSQLEEIVDKLSDLKVLDLVKLKTMLEDKWGVKAAAPVAMAAMPAAAAAPAEEAATEFNIVLKSVPADKKLNVIKTIREITQLGLKEAKDLTEKEGGIVKEKVAKAEAETVKKKLEEAGAVVAVLPA